MIRGTYAAFLRRWLWLLALGIMIGIGAGLLFRYAQPLEFQSRATLQMLPNAQLLASGLLTQQDINTLGQSLAPEVKIPSVLEAVSADMPANSTFSVDELAAMIQATPLTGSTGVEITVTCDNPAQPGLIAEKVASSSSQQIVNDQEAKIESQISQLDRSLKDLKAQMAAADEAGQQGSGGNLTATTLDDEIAALRELYRTLYGQYMSLSLGLPTGTGNGNMTSATTINQVVHNLQALKDEIDKTEAVQQQAAGGVIASVANQEATVRQQLYDSLYRQYLNLSIGMPITADQLFMPVEMTPVHEVSTSRISIRNAVVLGVLGGLALAWFVAGSIEYIRRRRTSGQSGDYQE